MFDNKSQVDAATVLMLLGEATIWKAVWTRMRGRPSHWTHYIFSISLGWTPLAGTLFAAVNGGTRPFNLIYERVPEDLRDSSLLLTNLDSGATHSADQTVLRNIWETWQHGVETLSRDSAEPDVDLTRQVGVMDLDLDKLTLSKHWAVAMQATCLAIQLVAAVVFWAVGLTAEVLILLLLTLLSQALLLASITPRPVTWRRVLRGKRGCPVMLHRGLDSTKVLILHRTVLQGHEVSLEEFCWNPPVVPVVADRAKAVGAGIAFLALIMTIVMLSWMEQQSKRLYLFAGSLGLFANAMDAALQPDWSSNLDRAFTGPKTCSPRKSSLLGCIGILVAASFPNGKMAAKLLYPDNSRFRNTLHDLDDAFDQILCQSCCHLIRRGHSKRAIYQCQRQQTSSTGQTSCATTLAAQADLTNSKQLSDAFATVSSLLTSYQGSVSRPIETWRKIPSAGRHSYW